MPRSSELPMVQRRCHSPGGCGRNGRPGRAAVPRGESRGTLPMPGKSLLPGHPEPLPSPPPAAAGWAPAPWPRAEPPAAALGAARGGGPGAGGATSTWHSPGGRRGTAGTAPRPGRAAGALGRERGRQGHRQRAHLGTAVPAPLSRALEQLAPVTRGCPPPPGPLAPLCKPGLSWDMAETAGGPGAGAAWPGHGAGAAIRGGDQSPARLLQCGHHRPGSARGQGLCGALRVSARGFGVPGLDSKRQRPLRAGRSQARSPKSGTSSLGCDEPVSGSPEGWHPCTLGL